MYFLCSFYTKIIHPAPETVPIRAKISQTAHLIPENGAKPMHYNRRQYLAVSENTPLREDPSLSETAGLKVLTCRTNALHVSSILTGKPADPDGRKRAGRALGQVLAQFHPGTRVLCAGIGNPAVTPDSLGPRCIAKLVPSPDTVPALFTVAPDVPSRTGMDTAGLIRAAAQLVRADCIITVDALAAQSEESLASLIQITDRGTEPGSGTGESQSSAITEETMGIPVISVGVPTIIEAGNLLVTPADCDLIADIFSGILAWGITSALFR